MTRLFLQFSPLTPILLTLCIGCGDASSDEASVPVEMATTDATAPAPTADMAPVAVIPPAQQSPDAIAPTADVPFLYSAHSYLFGDRQDDSPSTIEVQAGVVTIVCTASLPGQSPMTQAANGPVACDGNASELTVEVLYPDEALPPRPADWEPPATPPPNSPQVDCDESACSTGGVEGFDAAPNFPHLQVNIFSRSADQAELRVLGTDRNFETLVALQSPSLGYSVEYLEVD